MFNQFNEYLQFGVDTGGDPSSWPFAIAALLMVLLIMQRQSDD